MFKDKELRGYIGAATVFLLVMGLLLFLAFFEIPDTNNDIFKVIRMKRLKIKFLQWLLKKIN